MPSPTYGRTRLKTTLDYLGSNVILGKIYRGIQVGGVYTGSYSPTPEVSYVYDYHANRNWEKAELTQDSVHVGPPYLSGDAFSCLKYIWSTPYSGVHGKGTYYARDKSWKYVGGFNPPSDYCPLGVIDRFAFWANPISVLLRTDNNTNHPSMSGYGDTAWKRTKPKLQEADAGVFTAELRDMPHMLKQASKRYDQIWRAMGGHYTSQKEILKGGGRLMQPSKVADDFLAQQFGWIPFVKDLIKFDNVVQHYYPMLTKLKDRNDRWVRRRVTIKDETEISTIRTENANRCFPGVMNSMFWSEGAFPTYTVEEVKKTKITAVGKFRYYRPEFAHAYSDDNITQWNQAQQFLTLTGFRITPSNVYRAFPWTWAIDWFSNVGDWVDNFNDVYVDSIVSEYCFAMQHQKTVRVAIQQLPFASGGVTMQFEREIESKQRIKASSPYDFNLSWDSLTPRQLAIAAALGIGRFPKHAR